MRQRTVLVTATLLLFAVCPSGCEHSAHNTLEQSTTLRTRLKTHRNVEALSTHTSLLARGGSIKAVGWQKLERVARNTALGVNATTLAGILDTDHDLVGVAAGAVAVYKPLLQPKLVNVEVDQAACARQTSICIAHA